MSNPVVVDLSHWNPDPDWQALKAGGTVGVILKATDGSEYVDPTFSERFDAATDAGLFVAAYHFLRKSNVHQQMANLVEEAGALRGFGRLCLDYEDATDNPATTPTLDDLGQACYLLKSEGDFEVTVYGGSSKLMRDIGSDYMHDLGGTSLWIAHYTDKAAPTWPTNQWPNWSLWQYSKEASYSGISEPCDGNRWNGSPDNLQKWFYRPEPTPDDEPVPDAVVTITLDAPDGVEVRVIVNGKAYG